MQWAYSLYVICRVSKHLLFVYLFVCFFNILFECTYTFILNQGANAIISECLPVHSDGLVSWLVSA